MTSLYSSSDLPTLDLRPADRVAWVTSHRLGDSLISMIVVHNLRRAGYEVGVFSQAIYALRDWFPGVTAFPFDELPKQAASYQHVWFERPNRRVEKRASPRSGRVVILKGLPYYQQGASMAEVQRLVCRKALGLDRPVLQNGLVVPREMVEQRNPKKVILHPTSSSWLKTWPLARFLSLAAGLQQSGYDVEFVTAPEERAEAGRIRKAGLSCFVHPDLSRVAERLCSAGWFIGNDSGLGQLASNVGTPTLILFPLRRRAVRWLPCWAPARAVLPSIPDAVPEIFRHLLWKYVITPETVRKVFGLFVQDEEDRGKV